MHKRMTTWIAALTLLPLSSVALAQEITVMISGGFKAALEQLRPVYETQSGNQIVIVPGPSMGKTPQAIPNRLARGEKADVVIMVGDALTSLEKAGRTAPGSRTELADSPIGMVVKQGAPVPAINTPDALRQTLLQARSIAYSDSASGRYVSTALFKKLGIEAQVETARGWWSAFRWRQKWRKGSMPWGFSRSANCCRSPA